MFSCQFSKVSKNSFFTEHLRTTASAFSFSEAATGGVLWKKVFLKFLQNLQEKTFGLRNFQKHLFYRIPLDDCFWLFCAKMGVLLTMFGKTHMNIHYLEVLNLEVPFRYIYFEEHLPTTAFALHSHHSLLLIRFTLYSTPSSSSSLLLLIISPTFVLVQI